MPFGDLAFAGYWDASKNEVIGSPVVKGVRNYLVDGKTLTAQLFYVMVAGSTSLGGVTSWNVGDWAVNFGFGWGKFAGPNSSGGGQGIPGVGISSIAVNNANHLIVTYTDGSTQDAGPLPGGGFSGNYADLTNKPDLSAFLGKQNTYGFAGSYDIGSVGNGLNGPALNWLPDYGYQTTKVGLFDQRPGGVGGGQFRTLSIVKQAEGNGRFGPGNADGALLVSCAKTNWRTSRVEGEIDPVSFLGDQGQYGDMAAFGCDIKKRRNNLLSLATDAFTFSSANSNLVAGQTSFAIPNGYPFYQANIGSIYLTVTRNGTPVPFANTIQTDGVNLVLTGLSPIQSSDVLVVTRLNESGGFAMFEGNMDLVGANGAAFHRMHCFIGFGETPSTAGITGGRGCGFVAETRAGQWYSGFHAGGVADTFVDETGVSHPNSYIYSFTAAKTRDPATTTFAVDFTNGRVFSGPDRTAYVSTGFEGSQRAWTMRKADNTFLFSVGYDTGVAYVANGLSVSGGSILTFLKAGIVSGIILPDLGPFIQTVATTVNVPGAVIGDWATAQCSSVAPQYAAIKITACVINNSGDLEIRAQNISNTTLSGFGGYNFRWKVERFTP